MLGSRPASRDKTAPDAVRSQEIRPSRCSCRASRRDEIAFPRAAPSRLGIELIAEVQKVLPVFLHQEKPPENRVRKASTAGALCRSGRDGVRVGESANLGQTRLELRAERGEVGGALAAPVLQRLRRREV